MHQLATVLLLGCLCLQHLVNTVTAQQHCVCANGSSSTEFRSTECRLLEEYLDDIRDDSLLSFLAGTHILTQPWTIADVRNIIFAPMAGEEEVTIQCTSENAGLQFVNVSSLTIKGMNIFRCGMNATVADWKMIKSALIFCGGENLQLQSLNVSSSFVAGMSIHDVQGSVIVNSSNFTKADLTGPYNNYSMGNAISYFNLGRAAVKITRTRFERNRYEKITTHQRQSAGLTISLGARNVTIDLSHITLRENSGRIGGNMAVMFVNTHKLLNYSTLTVEDCVFEGGYGNVGGGAYLIMRDSMWDRKSSYRYNSSLPLFTIRNSNFSHNQAKYVGGGLYLAQRETYFLYSGSVIIEGCKFVGNRIEGNGGVALHFNTFAVRGLDHQGKSAMKVHMSNCSFTQHTATGDVKLGDAVILVKTSSFLSLVDTAISNNSCTGLLAIASNIVVSGNVTISHNHAFSGGGVLLCSGALLYFRKLTNLFITGNTAKRTGGGINVEMECVINKPLCSFQLDSNFNESNGTIHVTVSNNSANYAGDNIFGGHLSHCYFIDVPYDTSKKMREILHVPNNSLEVNSSIASSPHQVCLFDQETRERQCAGGSEVELYPGQRFTVSAVMISQESGLVPGTVHARLSGGQQYLGKGEDLQKIESRVSKELSYRVFSKEENITVNLSLAVDESRADPYSKPFNISVKIRNCPIGYTLNDKNTERHCSCEEIKKHTKNIDSELKCYISRRVAIEYSPPLWIGLVSHNSSYPQSIALSKSCPRDYCNLRKIDLDLMNLTINSSAQCYFHRSGVLCGGCEGNFSLILGSSGCREDCTHYHLFLIPVFALAGVLLVFVITFLNLTVSAGTIHGLIFYANIVQIYAALMFEKNDNFVASFLRIFLAWINLDFGFKTCFFRGMNGFSKALLQFVFPVYIWAIAGTVIFLSRRYTIVMKVLGENSVKVLATLILLSYTKVIRAAMDALHFTTITYLPGKEHMVFYHWSVDGRVKYLHDTHIVVFAVGLVFALASLPFVVTLLCIKHIGRFSNLPLCSWIHKLKPFFDSYTGPLTDSGRFWVGLLLLARLFLLGGYSFNMADSSAITMALTVVVCFVLLFVAMLLPKGIYKRHALNVLECFSLINLGMLFLLVICSLYYKSTTSRAYVVNFSTGCSFVAFASILVYHVSVKLKAFIMKCPKLPKCFKPQKNVLAYVHSFGFNEEESPLLEEIDYDRK